MVTRTRLMDDLIARSIDQGCDCVVNLAAGLDTRPYRMSLPAALRWIEVDLPAMVDEKERLLAGEQPRCRLSRERVDLADAGTRSAVLDRALVGTRKALVITEGLLVYLDEEAVRALGQALADRAGLQWWLLDLTSPAILQMMQQQMGALLVNAPMKFSPANGVAFFEALGWRAREIQSIFHAAARFRRSPILMRPFALIPAPNPRSPGKARWSAVVRFERASPAYPVGGGTR
jgi:methyltransferase (TIGR00027 family)